MYIDVPEYDGEHFRLLWEDGYFIQSSVENDAIVIKANAQGLISLARHMLELSQESVPSDCHFHLDMYNALEDNSTELIIIKSEESSAE